MPDLACLKLASLAARKHMFLGGGILVAHQDKGKALIVLPGANLFLLRMHKSVARCAQGDQIVLGVVSELALRLDVVDVEFARTPTTLATPAIPLQDVLAQAFVGLWVKAKSRAFWKEAGHSVLQIWA